MSTKTKSNKTASAADNKAVDNYNYKDARRKNTPTAQQESFVEDAVKNPISVAYARRNKDLDPQLVWRGKEVQDWSELIVSAPPLYIQEKVHPKALIDDLLRQSKAGDHARGAVMQDLFADFNGIPHGVDKTEFYKHDQHWSNRMILGDSLQVMASLAEREGLRGQVQCIYFDPPYGIKFNSNFQWSTTSRDVKDGNMAHITREPEQVKAFRDTWRDGIHSYLTYLRDRLTVARDLLSESGSIFVQISNENVHRVRCVLDEVFGDDNCIATIVTKKASPETKTIKNAFNYILWYSKNFEQVKIRKLFRERKLSDGTTEDPKKLALWGVFPNGSERTLTTEEKRGEKELPIGTKVFRADKVRDDGKMEGRVFDFDFRGEQLSPGSKHCWRGDEVQMDRLKKAERLMRTDETLAYKYFLEDNWGVERNNVWEDTAGKIPDMRYVVETNEKVVQRCLLMASDPSDLVLDPTCGSGTTAFVAEQWGRRWITIDTSRVALALARARVMGSRYPFYLLADSREGQLKEAEVSRKVPSSQSVQGNIRQGFVYERVPHITLKGIANNAEIDEIWQKWQETLEPLRKALNEAVGKSWAEWEIPEEADTNWSLETKRLHAEWWKAKKDRQYEVETSIVAKAMSDPQYLFDKPYEDRKRVRVAGPFTVESLSPHRTLGVDENDELIDPLKPRKVKGSDYAGFVAMILDNLRTAGVQQAHKEDKIDFTTLEGWPGTYVCAEGRYMEGDQEKRAAIFIGPEFGTVQRADLVEAAREAADARFDVLVSCAFNYDALSTDLSKLGKVPILKARINADLHMGEELKNNGKGNLFVIFGEPDIHIIPVGESELQVKINGVDVFRPNTGEVVSNSADGIACWFIDTDYNEESFFVRHAYFLGASDPYSSLKTTLKAEINPDAWASLNSDTSRPFPKPSNGRIAVKVINHLGDEVMKVFRVG